MIALGAAGAWYFWIRLPQGDRQRRLQHIRTLGDLLACTPREFERRVGDILAETGYRSVRCVGGSGDLAADLTCRDQSGKSVVVQCKRYVPGHRVGSPDIQQFIGMMTVHHKADHGLFVTTSDFSGPAIDLARKHHVTLIGGRELTDLVHKIQLQRDSQAGAKQKPTSAVG
ncbi:MAG TPA: restriction endonuclease [bacterium]|nr:restriction endonuclease [bacterium]